MRQQCQGLDQSIRWLIGLDSCASLIHPETIHSPIVEMHVRARFLGYIRCCAFSTGKRFSKVSDFILLSTFVCVTKVINIRLIIPGYQVGLRVDPKLFQNVHRYHNHWLHTKNHLHKNGWRRRCARARRSGPTNSRLVRAAAASQGNWSRSEVILPRGASTRLTIFEKQLFHLGTSTQQWCALGQASEYFLPWTMDS